jgi:hypothetical protein
MQQRPINVPKKEKINSSWREKRYGKALKNLGELSEKKI